MHDGQNKFYRLIFLDDQFRSPEGVSISQLMARLEDSMEDKILSVSKRTIWNDIRELEEEFGARFVTESVGREKLYRYEDPDFSILKEWISKYVDTFQHYLKKLENHRGDVRYDMIRYFLLGIKRGLNYKDQPCVSFDYNPFLEGLKYFNQIADAITHQYPIKLTYKPYGKERTEYNVHPYHLRQYNNRWFLFGLTEGMEEFGVQNYALDRIRGVEHLSKQYIPTDISFDDYFKDIVGVSNNTKRTIENIILRVNKKSLDYIRTKPIHSSQKEVKSDDFTDYITISIQAKINTELIMVILSYGDSIEVIEPQELRSIFIEKVANLRRVYNV